MRVVVVATFSPTLICDSTQFSCALSVKTERIRSQHSQTVSSLTFQPYLTTKFSRFTLFPSKCATILATRTFTNQ